MGAAAAEEEDEDMTETQVGAATAQAHYGDPRTGCLADEDVLILGEDGRVCAPHKALGECVVGGRSPSVNGCPQDSARLPGSQAWPICLRSDVLNVTTAQLEYQDASSSAAEGLGPFGCFMACGPCRVAQHPNGCPDDAHKDCPGKSRCVLGWHKAVTQGICVYPNAALEADGENQQLLV